VVDFYDSIQSTIAGTKPEHHEPQPYGELIAEIRDGCEPLLYFRPSKPKRPSQYDMLIQSKINFRRKLEQAGTLLERLDSIDK